MIFLITLFIRLHYPHSLIPSCQQRLALVYTTADHGRVFSLGKPDRKRGSKFSIYQQINCTTSNPSERELMIDRELCKHKVSSYWQPQKFSLLRHIRQRQKANFQKCWHFRNAVIAGKEPCRQNDMKEAYESQCSFWPGG